MDQRKLIQHGLSSLTVALPSKWIQDYGLKKGDTISIKREGKQLIIGTSEGTKAEKITVDVSGLDRTSILLYIQSLYRYGYNEIEIRFEKPTAIHYRKNQQVSISATIHQIVNRLIGAEVIEQSENKIIIKHITREAEEDFNVVLRRAFLLLKEASSSLIEGIKKNNYDLIDTIEEKHDNVNKFVSYALRLLNKYGYPDVKKTCFYYHIIASIDKMMDIMKYAAREIVQYKTRFTKDSITILEHTNDSIQMYYDLFYKFDLKMIDALSKNRDFVKELIKKKLRTLPQEELIQITAMKQILEIILDLTDFRMGLEN